MQTEFKVQAQAVFLRKFVPEDADKVFKMSIENSMRTWIPDQVYRDVTHAQEVLAFLIDQYQDDVSPTMAPVVLGICLAGTGELIGHIGISPLQEDVEVGYAIEERQQGKGYAGMAVRAMCEWALAEFALPRLLGVVAVDNRSSCRVLEKAGFRLLCEETGKMHGIERMLRKYEITPTSLGE